MNSSTQRKRRPAHRARPEPAVGPYSWSLVQETEPSIPIRARTAPAYIAIFVAASLVAAGVYWFAQPRAEAVRARADIPLLTPITADMVELVRVAAGDRPADAATSLDEVVGPVRGHADPGRPVPRSPRPGGDARAAHVRLRCALPPGHVAFALAGRAGAGGGRRAERRARWSTSSRCRTRSGTLPADVEAAPEAAVLGEGLVVLALRTVEGQALTDAAAELGAPPACRRSWPAWWSPSRPTSCPTSPARPDLDHLPRAQRPQDDREQASE